VPPIFFSPFHVSVCFIILGHSKINIDPHFSHLRSNLILSSCATPIYFFLFCPPPPRPARINRSFLSVPLPDPHNIHHKSNYPPRRAKLNFKAKTPPPFTLPHYSSDIKIFFATSPPDLILRLIFRPWMTSIRCPVLFPSHVFFLLGLLNDVEVVTQLINPFFLRRTLFLSILFFWPFVLSRTVIHFLRPPGKSHTPNGYIISTRSNVLPYPSNALNKSHELHISHPPPPPVSTSPAFSTDSNLIRPLFFFSLPMIRFILTPLWLPVSLLPAVL